MAGDRTMIENVWGLPQTLPALADGGVQVWRIQLGRSESSRQEIGGLLDRACAVLTREERERAAGMRVGAPREEFVAGRGCLRRLLGAALEVDPRTVVLETGQYGKPRLRGEAGIQFNVAHSKGVVLIALSRAGEVGVDVECLDPRVELIDVARTAFHPADMMRIDRVATQDGRLHEFYRCWTRKEAVLKADGRGLSGPLGEFSIGDAVVAVPGTGVRYAIRGIDVGPLHLGAIALVASECSVRLLEFSPRSPLLFAE